MTKGIASSAEPQTPSLDPKVAYAFCRYAGGWWRGPTARQAWWLSRLAPHLYASLMARRLRAELESDAATTNKRHDRGPQP